MSEDSGHNGGKRIGDIVQSALQSGDFSRLKDLGPAVKETVSDLTGVTIETRKKDVPVQRPQQAPQPQPQRPAWQGQAAPGTPGKKKSIPTGIANMVFGAMGMVAFGLCTLVFGVLALIFSSTAAAWVTLAAVCGALFGASGLLLGSGIGKRSLGKRVAKYYELLAQKPVYTFEEMAAIVGRTPAQIKKDVRKARAKRLMDNVRTDADETCLIYGEAAYQQYLETERHRAERELEESERQRRLCDPSTAGLERFRSEGVETIRKIRAANEDIPGEEISGKLSRLEATCAHIFTYVEAHPDKLPETRKFMDYYLPTSLKLVEKYQQYENMDYQPDNVKQTKADIEKALDNIDAAFNNFLESLFDDDTLDVATDIEVLQTLLEQEGLTGKRFEIEMDDKIKL